MTRGLSLVRRRRLAELIDDAILTAALELARRSTGAPSLFSDADLLDEARADDLARDRVVAVVFVLVMVLTHLRSGGRTPGRAVAGIRLVGPDGRPAGFGRVLLREGSPYASSVAVARLCDRLARGRLTVKAAGRLGFGVAMFAARRRYLGGQPVSDHLAHTRVVRS